MIFRSKPTQQRSTLVRPGITLLEVIISMAVAVIGLFGVMVLIPVAARLAETGLELDEAGALGRKAIEEFEVRGMRDPDNWIYASVPGGSYPVDVQILPNQAYCIDPEFYDRNATLLSGPALAQHVTWFPTNGTVPPQLINNTGGLWKTAAPSMRRITLRCEPGASFPVNSGYIQQVFSSTDDLQFAEPTDKTYPPVQIYDGSEELNALGSNPEVLTKRQALAEKSWIAMLVPRRAPTGFVSSSGMPESDLYTLYVVVFTQRDSNLTSQIDPVTGTLAEDPVEKWCEISFNTTGSPIASPLQGMGGGEIIIRPISNPATIGQGTGTPADTNHLVRDEWMLVCQRIQAQRQGFIELYDQFRWYRVSDVSDKDDVTGIRYVSLDGPDWTTPAETANADGSIQYGPIYGVKMKGVLEVYERTVRLESNSIWTMP